MINSEGHFTHCRAKNLIFTLDPNMQVELHIQSSLYNLSNSAAVWEPFV